MRGAKKLGKSELRPRPAGIEEPVAWRAKAATASRRAGTDAALQRLRTFHAWCSKGPACLRIYNPREAVQYDDNTTRVHCRIAGGPDNGGEGEPLGASWLPRIQWERHMTTTELLGEMKNRLAQAQGQDMPGGIMGNIQIRGMQLGGGMTRISVSNVNGVKRIEADENGKKVRIDDDPQNGIKMEVTTQTARISPRSTRPRMPTN